MTAATITMKAMYADMGYINNVAVVLMNKEELDTWKLLAELNDDDVR